MYFSSFCSVDFFLYTLACKHQVCSSVLNCQLVILSCFGVSDWKVFTCDSKKVQIRPTFSSVMQKIFRYNSAVFSLASKVFSFDQNQMFKYDLKVFSSDSEMFWDDSEVYIAEFEVFSGCFHVQICKLVFLISFFRISADILCSPSDTLCWHLCYLFPEPVALSILLHVQGSNHAGNDPRQSTFRYFESCW